MKEYDVTISEKLEIKVKIKADSLEEAECIAEKNWLNSEYVLNADNFIGVDFKAKKTRRDRDSIGR